MYLAVMVGKFVKQDVREWCPSTTDLSHAWIYWHFQRGVGGGVHNVGQRKHHGAEQQSGVDDSTVT